MLSLDRLAKSSQCWKMLLACCQRRSLVLTTTSTVHSHCSQSVLITQDPVQAPLSRWALDELYAPDAAAGRMYARCAGFVAGVDRFDAGCLGMPAAEALATDPQQRLLLEEAASAVASAPGGMGSWAGSLAGELAVGHYSRIRV